MLRSMYDSVKTCVKVNASYIQYFDNHTGVKRELSRESHYLPCINDLSEQLKDETADIVTINALQLFFLVSC